MEEKQAREEGKEVINTNLILERPLHKPTWLLLVRTFLDVLLGFANWNPTLSAPYLTCPAEGTFVTVGEAPSPPPRRRRR